ncbi:MAG: ACP S-malonyltransferase [Actinomycetia bacterium]|nr:ACP S-malonyltransferase [Actinomycetes bacterium]
MSYAVLFPGQGSQSVEMCPDVRERRTDLLGRAANDVLGWNLDRMISQGPAEELLKTQHAQPALYATSFALWSEFSDAVEVPPSAGAGHSLGEYTALAAAEVFSYVDGLALVARRGLAMADAAEHTSSGMAALIGADLETAEDVASRRRSNGGDLYVANINAPGQIVVAGGTDDIEWLVANARDQGIRRAIVLKVAGGFHSPFMAPAAAALSEALEGVTMRRAQFTVYANVSAEPTTDPHRTLSEQLTAPVRFSETLSAIAASGVDTFIHIGPGDVTAGLAKRTVDGATIHVVSTIDEAREVASVVSVQ